MWDKCIFTGGSGGEKWFVLVLENSVICQCCWSVLEFRWWGPPNGCPVTIAHMRWEGVPGAGRAALLPSGVRTGCRCPQLCCPTRQQRRAAVLQRTRSFLYGKWVFSPLRCFMFNQQIARLLCLVVRLESPICVVQQRSLAEGVAVRVGPAVNSIFCLKHFVACSCLWRTRMPSG